MNKIIYIALLIMVAPAIGKNLLEFRAAQAEERAGWEEMQFEGKSIWVSPMAEINSKDMSSVEVTPGGSFHTILITFSYHGGKILERFTKQYIGKKLAIIYEGKILFVPAIRKPISGRELTIFGSFTETEAQEMASKINKAIKSNQSPQTIGAKSPQSAASSHYHRHHDGKSLYAILYTEVSNGDHIEKIEDLLGPGKEIAQDTIDRMMPGMKKLASEHPEDYPDGVRDTDILIGYTVGEDKLVILIFRDGLLVNYTRDKFEEFNVF